MRGTLSDGDTLLVCSDGLVIEVEDDEIAALLDSPDSHTAAGELMDLALARGARDNITLQVIRIEEMTGAQWSSTNDTAINYGFRKRILDGVRTEIQS